MGRFREGSNREANTATQSHQRPQESEIAQCSTGNCGTATAFSRGIMSSVPASDLRQTQTVAGSPYAAIPGIINSSGPTANQGVTTSTSGLTKTATAGQQFNDTGAFLLMDGVNVRVDNLGRISATITLSENEANGAAIKNEFKGTTPDGGFHQPGMDVAVDNRSAKVDYDHSKVRLWESKAGAQDLYHVSAASNVDSITITIPGRDTPITLSREQILQAKQNAVAQETAKKEAADKAAAEPKAATETATPKASAPGAIPEPKKGAGSTAPTAEVPTEQPQAAVKKTEVAPPPATETVKPPEASPAAETPSAATSRQEYEEKLSVQAKEVESALRGNRGYLWNDPVEALWQPNLRRALDQFPSVEARAALVEQVGPEKLGVLIYSRKEFQAPGGAMDMILEPLQLKADTLKSTVDTIAYEFSRSLTGYDRPAIKAALSKLDSLEQDSPGASKLAAVHYSSKTGDNTPGTFDKAVETLRAAVASKAE